MSAPISGARARSAGAFPKKPLRSFSWCGTSDDRATPRHALHSCQSKEMTMKRAFALALFLLPFVPAVASAGELTVTVSDIKNDTGWVLAAVYDSEASFLKPPL